MKRYLIFAALALFVCMLVIGPAMFGQEALITVNKDGSISISSDAKVSGRNGEPCVITYRSMYNCKIEGGGKALPQMAVPDADERQQELQEEWEDCFDADPVTRKSAMCQVIKRENL